MATSSNRDDRIVITKAVIEYIKERYEDHIYLRELSERFHVSEGHLCRIFKGITKKSIVDYINYYRISVSLELLRMKSYDIGQIASLSGFNNISYYNKMFRIYMHMTPSAYRKVNQT